MVRLTERLYMTIAGDWDVKNQTNQPTMPLEVINFNTVLCFINMVKFIKKIYVITVIFLQIRFYESRDSLGQNSLHPKLEVLHPIWGPL